MTCLFVIISEGTSHDVETPSGSPVRGYVNGKKVVPNGKKVTFTPTQVTHKYNVSAAGVQQPSFTCQSNKQTQRKYQKAHPLCPAL